MSKEPTLDHGVNSERLIRLRYPGRCRECGTAIAAKTAALYDGAAKLIRCLSCAGRPAADIGDERDSPGASPNDTGVAGASARREFERRKARNEERLRARWGRLGGLAVALSAEQQSTTAWDRGAMGEEILGARLDGIAGPDLAVLHDRRIPGSRANIDHLVVTGAGVWVVDAKRYKGRPRLKVEGGILRPRCEKLIVGRRDCTKLVDGVLGQVEHVRSVVSDVPVIGSLCFVAADWPLVGGAFTTRGVQVLWPKRLTKLLVESIDRGVDVQAAREILLSHFRPA